MTKQRQFVLYVIALGCVLNFIWEYWHMPLFNFPDFIENLNLSRTALSIVGTVNAVLTTLLIAFIIKKIHQAYLWQSPWNVRKILEVVFLGGFCMAIYETIALATGLWGYSDAMPVVPLLNISLTGFVQYLTIPLLVLYVSSKAKPPTI